MPLLVKNLTNGAVLADHADAADTSEKRRTGLLKHTSLPQGEGLWIVPCEGIHTIGMKFPIDVVFLDKKKRVVKVRKEMGKWRMSLCLWAHSVLELPSGTVDATGTEKGHQLHLEDASRGPAA